MTLENLSTGGIDYLPCRYGKSKMMFRGPKGSLDRPYVAVLGGTEIYGKFVELPLTDILGQHSDHAFINLGHPNAGLDAFLGDPAVLDICASAEMVVIEAPGAHNLSNRFYSVHPRRNDRFLKASSFLQSLYRDIDFAQFHYTRHLLHVLRENSRDKFALVVDELQSAWVARMRTLFGQINNCVCLLWLSDHPIPAICPTDPLGHGPLFVDRAMMDELSELADAVVEVAGTREEIEAGQSRMLFAPMEEPVAREMLGPVVHESAARQLQETLALFLD